MKSRNGKGGVRRTVKRYLKMLLEWYQRCSEGMRYFLEFHWDAFGQFQNVRDEAVRALAKPHAARKSGG